MDRGIGAHADALCPIVDQLLIHLVAEHVHLRMAQHKGLQNIGLVLVKNTSGGVVGVVDDDKAGLVGAGSLQSLGGDAVILLIIQLYLDGYATGSLNDRLVGHPCGIQHHHLVSLVENGLHRQIDGILAAGRYYDAVDVIVQIVFLSQLLLNGLTQLRQAGAHHIVGIALRQTADGCHRDAVRCGKVRLASRQADNGGIGFLHLLGACHQYHGGRGLHAFNTMVHGDLLLLISASSPRPAADSQKGPCGQWWTLQR